ncbi:PIN domain-containing protein [Nocardiopsis sp. NPDC006139]|uniref:type II toxin-antitoxin system VapC family toxin n=1 Tax=Nocardiopsis sp. NPDC006139 TaxID=3154578 RepID=UPI0033AC51F7
MADVPLIFVDADVYMDVITRSEKPHPETRDPRWKMGLELFKAIHEGKARLAVSSLLEAEVLTNGKTRERRQRSAVVEDHLSRWFGDASVEWTDIDRYLVRQATRIAEELDGISRTQGQQCSAADRLHLAAAVRLGCGFLMTYDQGYPIGRKVRGISIMYPGVVWPEDLFSTS